MPTKRFSRESMTIAARAAAFVAVGLVPVIFIVAMNRWFDSTASSHSEWQVRHARTIDATATVPRELPESGWTTVVLPHRAAHGAGPTRVWYRFEIEIPERIDGTWAAYLRKPIGSYAVFVNGELAENSGSMLLRVRPLSQFFEIHGALLYRGRNVIDLRCANEWSTCAVDKVLIGPAGVLAEKFRSTVFFEITIKQATLVCMLTMSLIMVVLFRARSRDSMFGWYSLALAFWAVHIWLDVAPLSLFRIVRLRECFLAMALEGYLICTIFFYGRFIGNVNRKMEKMLVVWVLLGSGVPVVSLAVFGHSMFWFYAFVLFPPLILVSTYQALQLVRLAWDPPAAEARALASVAWLLSVVGLRDDFVQVGWIKGWYYYYPYTVGFVLLALGFILLRHFMLAVEFAEKAREELAIRVAEKTTELEHNLLTLKDLQHEQALSMERERIMRDMHDGVGGQLVQALSIAISRPELRPLEEPLRACLDELRLIIDSIEPTNGDLGSVLGTLRTRMGRRLTVTGVQMHWQVEDIPALTDFGPQRVFHVTHIVREAIANVLKHSQAKNITLRARVAARCDDNEAPATITIEIADDGTGLVAGTSDGRGLSNMRRRAEYLSAKLFIESLPTGTTVRLELPGTAIPSKADEVAQAPG